MRITNLLEGATDDDNNSWVNYLDSVQDQKEILLWYPSSGNDFTDVLNFTSQDIDEINYNNKPTLFIHNDYYKDTYFNISRGYKLYTNDGKQVEIKKEIKLKFKLNTKGEYLVKENYVDFYEESFTVPYISLFEVTIGYIEAKILYFGFENINLFELFILNSIKIDFLIKVREGCGLGGNIMSITQVYFFLSNLKVKYLIIDNEIHWNNEVINLLRSKYKLMPMPYSTTEVRQYDWSGFEVKKIKIKYKKKSNFNQDRLIIESNFPDTVYFGN